jgi:hypothetical protein
VGQAHRRCRVADKALSGDRVGRMQDGGTGREADHGLVVRLLPGRSRASGPSSARPSLEVHAAVLRAGLEDTSDVPP